MSDPVMLSVREIAAMLGVRTHTVTALIRANELKNAVDISLATGGRATWRVSREDFEEFLSRRTQTPAPPRRRKREPLNVKQYF